MRPASRRWLVRGRCRGGHCLSVREPSLRTVVAPRAPRATGRGDPDSRRGALHGPLPRRGAGCRAVARREGSSRNAAHGAGPLQPVAVLGSRPRPPTEPGGRPPAGAARDAPVECRVRARARDPAASSPPRRSARTRQPPHPGPFGIGGADQREVDVVRPSSSTCTWGVRRLERLRTARRPGEDAVPLQHRPIHRGR